MPDCEVLAALVPERVLPFASGDSRKRWLKPSRGEPRKPRWGAERRARPPPNPPPQAGEGGEKARAASQDAVPQVRLSAPRLPSFRGGLWNGLVGKTRMRTHRGNDFVCAPLPACGERSSEARVRGPLRDSELRSLSPAATPPHPNLLPARGEKERVSATRTDRFPPPHYRGAGKAKIPMVNHVLTSPYLCYRNGDPAGWPRCS
jgi:hypothetical protein